MEKKYLSCALYTAHEIWNVSSSSVRKNSYGEGSQKIKSPASQAGLGKIASRYAVCQRKLL
jgi:hypothetical protein